MRFGGVQGLRHFSRPCTVILPLRLPLTGISAAQEQPKFQKADDSALEVSGGHGHLLCEPFLPQKAGQYPLQVSLGGVYPLCEFRVEPIMLARRPSGPRKAGLRGQILTMSLSWTEIASRQAELAILAGDKLLPTAAG